jgi:hypothetical protein
MKIPFEEHSEKFGKVIAAMLKLAIFLGGACVVAYSLRIGRFPQGLTIGDSLLLVMAAICFGAVASLFVFSLVSLGIMLSPMVRFSFWITGKIIPKFANAIKKSPYTLAPLSWFAAVGALFAVLIIVGLAQRDIMLAWNLPLLSIALYFVYSVSVSSHKQLVELGRIVDSPVDTPLRTDYGTHQRIAKLKVSRLAGPTLIVTTSLFFGGATGEVLDASMRATKIRIESPTVYIKQPYASLMPKALISATVQAPTDYVAYKDVTVLFHGFGTVTVLAFRDGSRQRTLDIPNDHLVVERN